MVNRQVWLLAALLAQMEHTSITTESSLKWQGS
jgi:hypothetical protein